MVLPVVALPLTALRCGGSVNKALRGPTGGCAQRHRWRYFLAVHEGALRGARCGAQAAAGDAAGLPLRAEFNSSRSGPARTTRGGSA